MKTSINMNDNFLAHLLLFIEATFNNQKTLFMKIYIMQYSTVRTFRGCDGSMV
jgi:hypothetical protein